MGLPRRKRGAQPGNHNALTHGIYAGLFGPKAQKILRRAQQMDPRALAEEIALLRTTLARLKVGDVDEATKEDREQRRAEFETNVHLLATLMRALIRAVAVHHGLNKKQEDGIHESMVDLLHTLLPAPRESLIEKAGGL